MAAPRRKLTDAEKQRNRIIKEANRRMRLLEGQGIKSPALIAAQKKIKKFGIKTGYFSVKGIKDPVTRKGIEKYARHFLELPTSNIDRASVVNEQKKRRFARILNAAVDDIELVDQILDFADSRIENTFNYEVYNDIAGNRSEQGKKITSMPQADRAKIWVEAIKYINKPTEEEKYNPDIHFLESDAIDLAESWMKDAVGIAEGISNKPLVYNILTRVPNPVTKELYKINKINEGNQ